MNSFVHPQIVLRARYAHDTHQEKPSLRELTEIKKAAQEEMDRLTTTLFGQPLYGQIASHSNTDRLGSTTQLNIRERILAMYYQQAAFSAELSAASGLEETTRRKLFRLQQHFFSFFYKQRIAATATALEAATAKRASLQKIATESYVALEYDFTATSIRDQYADLANAFTALTSASRIWDITLRERNYETKSAAAASISRNPVVFDASPLAWIQTTQPVLHLQNYNGGDFYFYPSFIVYYRTVEDLAIIDYTDLFIHYGDSRFLESEAIPSDAEVIGETWDRVNKDGSPDKRFVNNFKLPIVLYGQLQLKTTGGINEAFQVSDAKKAKQFAEQYYKYKQLMAAVTYEPQVNPI